MVNSVDIFVLQLLAKRSWDIVLNFAVKGAYKVLTPQTPPPPFMLKFSRKNIENRGERGAREGLFTVWDVRFKALFSKEDRF